MFDELPYCQAQPEDARQVASPVANGGPLSDWCRRRSRLPDACADRDDAAALWLSNCRGLLDPVARPWILDIVRAYSEWTANANGADLAINDDFTGKPREWNSAYLDALANCLPVLTPAEVDKLALDPIRSLPEESFLDALATFIRDVDGVFFNDRRLSPETAVHVRSALAERLKETSRWQTLTSGSIMGSAVASPRSLIPY